MTNSTTSEPVQEAPKSFLIWGCHGWIAGHLYTLLRSRNETVSMTAIRTEDRESVIEELKRVKPTHVLNCAGVTGRPNVDWCEENKETTTRSNVIGTLNLTDCCFLLDIHITVFATGCKHRVSRSRFSRFSAANLISRWPGIYTYDSLHPMGGRGFLETDPANFSGSFYSATKAKTEEVYFL